MTAEDQNLLSRIADALDRFGPRSGSALAKFGAEFSAGDDLFDAMKALEVNLLLCAGVIQSVLPGA